MKSQWNETAAKACKGDLLKLRVYTSRLLGQESSLVLHGGGNTSVKATVKDFFNEPQDVLYIKGSGWDLATIEPQGFPAVKLQTLIRMASLSSLSDADMVLQQRAAMLNPLSPNPSVEAILHAIIPFTFVDHTHADAIVAISNTPDGKKRIQDIYGPNVLIVPYVMPGFVLAKKVYELTRTLDWSKCEGIVLLNHGLFTFAPTAKESYEQHLKLVTKAERYLASKKIAIKLSSSQKIDLVDLAQLRQSVSCVYRSAVIARLSTSKTSAGFASLPHATTTVTQGTLTPDHVIRTKPEPVVVAEDIKGSVEKYATAYQKYFYDNAQGKLTCLDLAPRWALWPKVGTVAFGKSIKETIITQDIIDHTLQAMQWSHALGGWKPISRRDLFEMEYWELEQAKLAAQKVNAFQGKIALVTGAASGIGQACVARLIKEGVHVTALDINPSITTQFKSAQVLGIRCDVTDDAQLRKAIDATIMHWGGLDILISNAGIFTPSCPIATMDEAQWDKSVAINLTSHQRLMTYAAKFLKLGIDPSIAIIASKNVPAPGPGASAYSVAKAGLTQLARIAALEMGADGVRVNVIHPNQIFDTSIWTPEVLAQRAKSYGLSVEAYKTNNILKVSITSDDVANLATQLCSPVFAKTTGAQIPIDGGNDRVI